jgi:hypothetical protein
VAFENISIPKEIEKHELGSEFPMELASDSVAAAAFLEGIALFELLGAKWILAITIKNWNEEVHEHAADEIRHTKIVQDAAKKLRWEMTPQELVRESALSKITYTATEEYLAALSKRIFLLTKRKAGEHFTVAAYYLLAFLIERRIMKTYPHFARFGATEELRETARLLVNEERAHLGFLNQKLQSYLEISGSTQEEIVAIDRELAAEWLEKITDAYQH